MKFFRASEFEYICGFLEIHPVQFFNAFECKLEKIQALAFIAWTFKLFASD